MKRNSAWAHWMNSDEKPFLGSDLWDFLQKNCTFSDSQVFSYISEEPIANGPFNKQLPRDQINSIFLLLCVLKLTKG